MPTSHDHSVRNDRSTTDERSQTDAHRTKDSSGAGRGGGRGRRRGAGSVALLMVLSVAVGCSATTAAAPGGAASGSTNPTASPTGSGGSTGSGGEDVAFERPACATPPVEAVTATPVADVPSDVDVASFDGTTIRAHWFPLPTATVAKPAATVLMGPGWSLPGDTNVEAVGVLGALNIASLRAAGFNVLTWDPRGFGKSTGEAKVNSADHEGRDVQRLIDWVSSQPEAKLDGTGDPRMGMVGGSYGGGIQLVTAAIDCRVDAIVPVIAWHELTTSLYKAETSKSGWANILASVAGTRPVDPHVTSANAAVAANGTLSEEDQEWFADRGVQDLVGKINIPTLIVQGTVDTLFTLDEGVSNYVALRERGVPVGMLWFCGGHGTCLTDPGDVERVSEAGVAWLRRYVLDEESVDVGPAVRIIDQDGTELVADDYPLAAGAPIAADGKGTLQLVAEGGAGPIPAGASKDMLNSLVQPVTPARAANAVNVAIDPGSVTTPIVGAPTVTLHYTGTVGEGERPTRVFAQLVDEETGFALGNQITPIQVILDGKPHEVTSPLEIVAYTPNAGTKLTLQIVATTVAYAEPRLGGSITFDAVHVELPTATNLR